MLVVLIIIFTSIGQVLLKIGSISADDSILSIFIHPASLAGYVTFAIVAILSIYALKEMDLKFFFAVTSLTYVIVLFLSYLFLREKVTAYKVLGVMVITFGVIVFNL